MLNKLFRTQFQLSGNFLNNRETNAVVELIDVLGSVRFAATIICKANTDLLVADTTIQFLKHKFSGRGEVADELLELLEECYLKRISGNLILGLRFLCRFSAVILKFLKDVYMAVCRNWRNLPLSIMLVHHVLLPWISPQISLASWLNPLAFPIEAAGKPGPRRGHHQICDHWVKVVPPTSMEAERVLSVTGLFLTKLRTRLSKNISQQADFLK